MTAESSIRLPAAAMACCLLAAVIAVGGVAEAGFPGLQRVKTAKKPGGPYTDGVVNANPKPGTSKDRYVRVRSTAALAEKLTLQEHTPVPPDYRIRWFRGVKGSRNITADVRGAGYEFNLKPDAVKRFRVWIRAKPDSTSPELCYQGEFEGPAGFDYANFQINSPGACN